MNREKQDKIPSMQVSFIDAICTQLYEVNHILVYVLFHYFDTFIELLYHELLFCGSSWIGDAY